MLRSSRRLWRFLRLWTVLLGAVGGCSLLVPKFDRPTFSVVGVELVSGSFWQQNFLVKIRIQNPDDRALPVSSLHAELRVAGEPVASGVSNRAFVVPPQASTEFDMTVTANVAQAVLKLSQRAGKRADSIDYDLNGVANIDLPFLRNVAFHQTGSLALDGLLNH